MDADYVQSDINKGGKLYLHMKWDQVPKPAEAMDVEPVTLSLGKIDIEANVKAPTCLFEYPAD